MSAGNCPLCGKYAADKLTHLRLYHDIEDASQFSDKMNRLEQEKKLQEEFARLIEEWWTKVNKGEITPEDFRRLSSQWSKEHESSGG